MAGTRDRLIHGYFGVDYDIVRGLRYCMGYYRKQAFGFTVFVGEILADNNVM